MPPTSPARSSDPSSTTIFGEEEEEKYTVPASWSGSLGAATSIPFHFLRSYASVEANSSSVSLRVYTMTSAMRAAPVR